MSVDVFEHFWCGRWLELAIVSSELAGLISIGQSIGQSISASTYREVFLVQFQAQLEVLFDGPCVKVGEILAIVYGGQHLCRFVAVVVVHHSIASRR